MKATWLSLILKIYINIYYIMLVLQWYHILHNTTADVILYGYQSKLNMVQHFKILKSTDTYV